MNVFDWNTVSAIAELAGKDHVPWRYKPLAEL